MGAYSAEEAYTICAAGGGRGKALRVTVGVGGTRWQAERLSAVGVCGQEGRTGILK